MPKFRKKTVAIEAEQWRPGDIEQATRLLISMHQTKHRGVFAASMHTLAGVMHLTQGDWIITGLKAKRYPCKPDIFEATYEPVE